MGIDLPSYRRILEQCFPDLAISSIEFIGGGSFRVFAVNDRWIFRLPHSPQGGALLRQERQVYDTLQPLLSLPIPRFTYFSEGCPLFPRAVAGYAKLPGEPMQRCDLDTATQDHLGAQIGRFLSELHNIPPARLHSLALPVGTPAQERERQRTLYNQIQQLAFPLLNARQQAWTTALFASFLVEDPDWHFEPVTVHGDLDSTNILCQQTSGTLAGILDFEEARLGDAAWDLCALEAEYGAPFCDHVLGSYGLEVDAGFRRRVAFHARRILFHELLYGIQHDNQIFFAHGLVRLDRAMKGQEPVGGWLDASTSELREEAGFPA